MNMRIADYATVQNPMGSKTPRSPTVEPQGTVLVVEDQEAERRMMKQLLRLNGFRVYSTSNANDAIPYVHKHIDVVLTDMHMGEGSGGMKLIVQWKHTNPKTLFIFITGDREPMSAVEAMKLGAFDYLTKPVTEDSLIEAISKAIKAA